MAFDDKITLAAGAEFQKFIADKGLSADLAPFRKANEESFFKAIFSSVHGDSNQSPRMKSSSAPDSLDYAGWFNYFLAEAQDTLTETQRGMIFFLALELEVKNKKLAPVSIPTPMSKWLEAQLVATPGIVPLALLKSMFEAGFEEARMVKAADYFAQSFGLSLSTLDTGVVATGKVFAYRGDSRTAEVVMSHGGAKCRMQIAHWRDANNLDKAWHPWCIDPEIAKKMWFRKGSKDNDYFSLNSVAMDFHIACAYPILRIAEKGIDLKGPASAWTVEQKKALAAKGLHVTSAQNTVTGKPEEVLADFVNIYVYLLDSSLAVAATKDYNASSQYPESGVRDLSLDQILAVVKAVRYHHPPKSADSYYDSASANPSMTVLPFAWSWFHGERQAQAAINATEPGVKALEAILNGHKRKCFDINHSQLVSNKGTYTALTLFAKT